MKTMISKDLETAFEKGKHFRRAFLSPLLTCRVDFRLEFGKFRRCRFSFHAFYVACERFDFTGEFCLDHASQRITCPSIDSQLSGISG
jgi:hypothetical protein